ncbi:recombinase family protein [Ruminococcaceae bacterium OttesenSCG-928-O06]|nr:recombinase family protein [Ruminococcaceae bacterium OttesenSCG-928-O06]
MKYGYCRVSTAKQIAGTSLDEQEQKLCEQGAELIYRDGFTGTSADRPEFKKVLSVLREGDWFMVTKLDRFARNTQDALTIINDLRNKGVIVQILNMGVVDNTPMGKLMVTMLAAFAEFERDMIVERTQAGKQMARNDPNFRDGRPPLYGKQQIAHALELLDEGKTYRQVEQLTGMSKSTLIRAKRKRVANGLLNSGHS